MHSADCEVCSGGTEDCEEGEGSAAKECKSHFCGLLELIELGDVVVVYA